MKTQKQINLEKKNLWKFVKRQLPNDWDKFDIEGNYDALLNFSENKREIYDKIIQQFPKKKEEKPIDYPKQQLQEMEITIQELEIEKMNKFSEPNKEIEEYYKPIEEVIEQMKMGLCHLAFIRGRAGTGKSENIGRYLGKYFNPEDIIQITDVSEAFLYELFYKNNNKIFWLKDIDKLLTETRSLLVLKTACETKSERLITNYNYSHQKNLPKAFIFTGKLIFDYNEITNITNRESFEALISRGEFVNLNFSFEEMCDIMKKICDTNDIKLQVTNWLIENYKFVGFNQFNLRTQYRAFKWYEYAKIKNYDWKEYIKNKLQHNKTQTQQTLYTFIGNKTIKTTELKKILIRAGVVNTLRTAERRIQEYIELGELYKVSDNIRDFYVSLNPILNNAIGKLKEIVER